MKPDQIRQDFEEWIRSIGHYPLKFKDSQIYVSSSHNASWEGWRAALRQQSEIICRKCGLREERGDKPNFDF